MFDPPAPGTPVDIGDGWELIVDGAVVDDGGWSGGDHSSWTSVAWTPGTPSAEVERALRESAAAEQERARDVDDERVFRLRIRRAQHGLDVVVHERAATPRTGETVLYWPPVVGPSGVLVRAATVQVRGSGEDVTFREPWLVTPTGEIRVIPAQLGVAPLLELPAGGWLLPGLDPLWRDSYEEPLGVLAADGTTAPLLLGGEPLLPESLLATAAPAWRWTSEAAEEFPWRTLLAGIDARRRELRLLLSDSDRDDVLSAGSDPDRPQPTRWILLATPLDRVAPRLIARGDTPPAERP